MEIVVNNNTLTTIAQWLDAGHAAEVRPVVKDATDTLAWMATVESKEAFLKFFPELLDETRVATEMAIAGANLHSSIVPLRQTIPLANGVLLIYDRVSGENLGSMDVRKRFQFLPLAERIQAVRAIFGALTAIYEAGFMIVDWYEGNQIYDFERRQMWLFDWELCRRGAGFTLEMDNNYGSSRLMAPEEYLRGSFLDERTLVFNLGRYALMTLPELAEPLACILSRATHPSRAARFATLRELMETFVASARAECNVR